MGDSGLAAIEALVPALRDEYAVDLVVANGENAASGFGIIEENYKRIRAARVDVVTSGNHVWEKRDFMPLLESEERVLRPANYPKEAPGPLLSQQLFDLIKAFYFYINFGHRWYFRCLPCMLSRCRCAGCQSLTYVS